jgi:NAD(P)-dependent dehydrogenase (short-subunit alcohol dehydrogenase family)
MRRRRAASPGRARSARRGAVDAVRARHRFDRARRLFARTSRRSHEHDIVSRNLSPSVVDEPHVQGPPNAAARNPDSVDLAGVTPIGLDVIDEASIAAAAQATGDVTLLINNAGSYTGASLLDGPWADIELEMNTHYCGPLAMTHALAPRLAAGGGDAILNVLSVLSWLSLPSAGACSAAKSAEWSLTNAMRKELAAQGTQVSGLHLGYMDTEMVSHIDAPKLDPVDTRLALDGIEAGDREILADDLSRLIRQRLAGGVAALYPQLA